LWQRYDVYVDAKITGMHDASLQRRAFVGFVVDGRKDLTGFDQVPASETDEAEERAILFAITQLRDCLKKFTVICDHESAVTKVNWKGDERKKAKKDKVLPEIWKVLDEKNRSVRVMALKTNPAHRFLNQQLKELESGKLPSGFLGSDFTQNL
jgi:hypothetical protein